MSWENHTVWSSGISRVWSGSVPAEPFPAKIVLFLLFIALSSPHIICLIAMTASLAVGSAVWIYLHQPVKAKRQINIRLISGDIISFVTDDDDSADQFYDALKSLAEGSDDSEIIFDKDGKIQEPPEEEVTAEAPGIMEATVKSAPNSLVGELKKLYASYTQKTDANSEILLLINDTARQIESGDREGLKTSFNKFVTLGLISDCNELGLNTLIQEITSSLY